MSTTREEAGFVYFAQAGGGDRPIKIGFSRDPHRRVKALSAEIGVSVNLLAWFKGTPKDEARQLAQAREVVARRVGCPPGTLENFRKDRLGPVSAALHDALRRAMISELQRQADEARAKLAEMTMDLEPDEVAEARSGLRQIHAVLAREARR